MSAQPRLAARPDLSAELAALQAGAATIAGVDEVGRGALAGPVVAAAVVLPFLGADPLAIARKSPVRAATLDVALLPRPWAALESIMARLDGVRDSKQLGAADRQRLDGVIRREALAVSVAAVDAPFIDEMGIGPAVALAMRLALEGLPMTVDLALVDGRPVHGLPTPHRAIVRGDTAVLSIAAASIVAKVHRDALMVGAERSFPGFGFARHKGYGTAAHLAAIQAHGPSALHRLTWRPFRPALPLADGAASTDGRSG